VNIVFLILFTHCSLTFSNPFIGDDDDDVKHSASHARVPCEIEVVAPKKQKSGVDHYWDGTISCNERDKLMDIDKNNLTRGTKEAEEVGKEYQQVDAENAANKQLIMQGLLATDGVNLSQATKYVEGATINGNNFCSQKAVKCYCNGFESDSDSNSN
jgi:hypothetical protein